MKYAILLDWGFVIRKLPKTHITRGAPCSEDMLNSALERVDLIKNHDYLRQHELLRTYFYGAAPATGNIEHPISRKRINLSNTSASKRNDKLIKRMETTTDMAVRLGELSNRGWKIKERALKGILQTRREITERDIVLNIVQKGVDIRIALDIARLSLMHTVDILVVITGDSDFVPAFKFARREGLRVYLDHMGHGIKRDLKVHVDRIIN